MSTPRSWRRYGPAAALALVTAVRLAAAAAIPLTPDEAYYWVWSRALAPGYLDHPPMVALWIRAGTALAGSGPLGVRLLGPLATGLGSLLLAAAARDLGAPRPLQGAILLNATLLFGAGAVTMTPDTPLLFFWTAALWAMARLIATGQGRWWLAAGAACGLAMCSKYTAALLPAGLLLWLVWARQWRWLARPQPWLGAALALALFAPVAWWNARHGWASFAKQGGRTLVFDWRAMPAHLAELVAGQAALATPLLLILCAAGLAALTRRALRDPAPGPVLLAALSLPAAALFVEHALGDRVQANWPAILYPAAAIAAGFASPRLTRALYRPGVALGAALTMLVYLQTALGLIRLPARLDPTLRLTGGYPDFARAAAADAQRRNAAFLAADDYGNAALLGYLAPSCTKIIGLGARWRLFDLPPAAIGGQTGLLLRSTRRHTPPSPQGWTGLAADGQIARTRDGVTAERYDLYRVTAAAEPPHGAILPCRHSRSSP